MGIFFGKKKKKKNEVSEKDRAILEIKRQRDNLRKYRQKINVVIKRETEHARRFLKQGNKVSARMALRKKKVQESTYEKTNAQLLNLDELVNSIEFASMQSKVFEALKEGNTVLTRINEEVSLEEVERLMEEASEQMEYAQEVDERLAGELTAVENEDVLEELRMLEEETAMEEAGELPSVPVQALPVQEEQPVTEEEEKETNKPVVILG